VGTLLVFGMLLAPAATGALLANRISRMIVIGIVAGSLSTYLGLLASYWLDVAASATIVLVAVAVFFATLAVTNLRAPRRPDGQTDPATGETLA
jgi:ABC-type Mn2+/Zn2+ transport system permease subunit